MSYMSKLAQNVEMYAESEQEYEILCHEVSTALNGGVCANIKVRAIIQSWEDDLAEIMEGI